MSQQILRGAAWLAMSTPHFDKMLVLMHPLAAIMQWRAADAYHLQRLAKG